MPENEELTETKESNWRSKITKLFEINPKTHLPDPKLLFVGQCATAGLFAGFLIGGRIGGRIGAVEHVENHQLALYDNPTQAERVYQGKVYLGALRNGLRFGWRAGLMAGFYSLTVVITNELNPENIGQNYLASGTLSGVFYNIFRGWRSMLVGAILGGGLTAPFAGLIGLVSMNFPERRHRFSYSNYMLGVLQPPVEEEVKVAVVEEEGKTPEVVDYFKTFSEAIEGTLNENKKR